MRSINPGEKLKEQVAVEVTKGLNPPKLPPTCALSIRIHRPTVNQYHISLGNLKADECWADT